MAYRPGHPSIWSLAGLERKVAAEVALPTSFGMLHVQKVLVEPAWEHHTAVLHPAGNDQAPDSTAVEAQEMARKKDEGQDQNQIQCPLQYGLFAAAAAAPSPLTALQQTAGRFPKLAYMPAVSDSAAAAYYCWRANAKQAWAAEMQLRQAVELNPYSLFDCVYGDWMSAEAPRYQSQASLLQSLPRVS